MKIAFGSDGYRGEIGHTLTKEAVARIVLGAAAYLRNNFPDKAGCVIPIGHDTRFLARPMALLAARLLREEGYSPRVAHRACPSPYLSFAVRHFGAPLGIELTASHNEPLFLGVKLKCSEGGSMMPAGVAQVEQYANSVDGARIGAIPLFAKGPEEQSFNLDGDYAKAITGAAGFAGDPAISLAIDFMHGAGCGIYRDLLTRAFTINFMLREMSNPLFGGLKPEPTPANLAELAHRLSYSGNTALGLAFDGDGDRLAVVDENGQHLASHEIFCLLLEHLASHLHKSGIVVTSVSFSGLVERVANAHGCQVYDVPVGFSNVTRAMMETGAIIGGEESGGAGFGHYMPERDALLMALMLLHARKLAGVPLSEMLADLYRRFGKPVFIHRDIVLAPGYRTEDLKASIRELSSLSEIAGDPIESLNHRDGMKLRTAGGWVLVRVSGTESLLRVYAEGLVERQAQAYADEVLKKLGFA